MFLNSKVFKSVSKFPRATPGTSACMFFKKILFIKPHLPKYHSIDGDRLKLRLWFRLNCLGSKKREKKENGELSLKSVKTELKQIDKSFNIQHPRLDSEAVGRGGYGGSAPPPGPVKSWGL